MSCKLNDVCELIVDCPHSTEPDEGDGYPIIRTPNIGVGYLDLEGVQRVSRAAYDRRNIRAVPRPNDLILAREAPAGNVGIIRGGTEVCLGQRTVLIRPNAEKVSPLFLNYYLNAPKQRHALLSNSNGATVSHINMPIIRNLVIELPDRETQDRIADVLSAYDELIENSRRQIKLLEEAAQRLYKEWFIDLKFPGHETAPIVDGLPEGWKRLSLREYLVSHIGGGWGKEFSESSYPVRAAVIRATDIEAIRNGNVKGTPVRWHAESNFQKRKLEPGDIVFEVSGGSKEMGVGRSLLITEEVLSMFDSPVICASFCKRVHLAESADSALLYWKIRNDYKTGLIRKYEKSSAGNIINFLWEDFLDGYELFVPSDRIKEQFESAASLYSKKLGICCRRISFAREARDRLLPKLMSGEIEV